eukprot:3868197-Alexandrium_andersonii.AAC.1
MSDKRQSSGLPRLALLLPSPFLQANGGPRTRVWDRRATTPLNRFDRLSCPAHFAPRLLKI